MAPSCSSVAASPVQTDLSLTLDAKVNKMEGLFKLFYSRFTESKIKLENLLLWKKQGGYFFVTVLLAFCLSQWDFILQKVNKQT